MSLNPLGGSPGVQASSPQVSNGASVRRVPTPQGIGSVGETVAEPAQSSSCCSCFQPIINFFSWISRLITNVFKAIFNFFVGCFREEGVGADVPPIVYQGLTVNHTKLTDAPEPLDFAEIRHAAETIQPPIEIEELLTKFDEICDASGVAADAIFYQDQGVPITREEARRSLENKYIGFVHRYLDAVGGGSQYEEYARVAAPDIDVFLKAIILELRKPTIPLDKKRLAIENLCSSAEHCPPRRHTESMKVYRVLSNKVEIVEEIVKQYIQTIKEDLFLEHYSESAEPVMTLNYIRKTVGQELGLDTNPVNLQDVFMSLHDARSRENPDHKHTTAEEFLGVFHQIYTPQIILSSVKEHIDGRCAVDLEWGNQELGGFIANELGLLQRQGVLTDDECDIDPYMHFGDPTVENDPTTITDAGVKFLLVHFGILSSEVPNGHLVRATAATPTAPTIPVTA